MGSYWESEPVTASQASAVGTPGISARSRRGGSQYQLLPFMQSLLDRIPRWLKWCLAAAVGVLGLGLSQQVDPADTATWLFGALGAFVGYYALPALIVLVEVTMQLAMVVVKLALVLAILAGVVYAVSRLAS